MQQNPATFFFKDSSQPDVSGHQPDTDEAVRDKPVRNHDAILCKTCGRVITREEDRISVQDTHRHTFANPQGLVFEIGCFQTAPGCAYGGPLTAEFTWFPGYQWKMAVCAGCLTHLGWLFVSTSHRFNGLILDRLMSDVSDGQDERKR